MGLPVYSEKEVADLPSEQIEVPPYKKPPKWRGAYYYLRAKLQNRPTLLNIEFTKLCNAKCFFCHCWQVESPNELQDYGPVVKRFRPLVCSVSGGEPLLRKNYAELLAGIRPWCHYLMIITNGSLLNEQSAANLRKAGVDSIVISLDYNSSQHDKVRKIEGLYDHISEIVPRLTAKGYRICFNSIIMDSNLDEVIPIAENAHKWGAEISFSSFCTMKSDETSEMVAKEKLDQLTSLVANLKKMKRKKGHIKNSDFYLDRIVPYFSTGGIENCKAGHSFIQVTPDGYIQRCAELPRMMHYSEYWANKVGKTNCTKCWYGCRGETEAPGLSLDRIPALLKA